MSNQVDIYRAIYIDVNYGVEFKFQPGVVLFAGGTTITAIHINSNLIFETIDATGDIFSSMQNDKTTWFNSKHVMLSLNYDNDTLTVTRKSSGQQIILTIPEIYKEKFKKSGKYVIDGVYVKYKKHKKYDIQNYQKKYEITTHRVKLLTDLIHALEKRPDDIKLTTFINPLRDLIEKFENETINITNFE